MGADECRHISLIISLLFHHLSYHPLTLSVDLIPELGLLKGLQQKPDSPLQLSSTTTSTRQAIADMESGASREDVIASKWWKAKAQKILMTTANIGKVEIICIPLPVKD